MKHSLIFLALLTVLIVFLNHQFPGTFEHEDNQYRLLYLVLLLVFIGGGTIASAKSRWREQVKHVIAWAAIFVVLMVGYTYRGLWLDSKLAAELVPGRTTIEKSGHITLNARADGHFYISARINGEKLLFMVDTGASDIMLTSATAKRIGLSISPDAAKRIYSTANGTSSGLAVDIPRMRIGSIALTNVRAYVNQGDATTNLLGMSFMNRLQSYSVEDGTMTLVP